ncbi:hypothetical protein ABT297_02325 [Dactylosporangium sp. NPDC000555]
MMHTVFLYNQLQHRQQGLLGLEQRERPAVRDERRPWWRRSRPS